MVQIDSSYIDYLETLADNTSNVKLAHIAVALRNRIVYFNKFVEISQEFSNIDIKNDTALYFFNFSLYNKVIDEVKTALEEYDNIAAKDLKLKFIRWEEFFIC